MGAIGAGLPSSDAQYTPTVRILLASFQKNLWQSHLYWPPPTEYIFLFYKLYIRRFTAPESTAKSQLSSAKNRIPLFPGGSLPGGQDNRFFMSQCVRCVPHGGPDVLAGELRVSIQQFLFGCAYRLSTFVPCP